MTKGLILSALDGLQIDSLDDSGWHEVVMQILEKADNGVLLPREFFTFIYERSLCTCCRHAAVLHMGKRRLLTAEMIGECRYDVNPDLVGYAEKK